MASPGYLILLFLVMTINCCNCQWIGNRDRRMPPPVSSFLEKIKNLGSQESRRVVRDDVGNHALTDKEREEYTQKKAIENSINNFWTQLGSLPRQRDKRYISSISMRGCHLGTCQIQNLASMLYRLGNNNYKDDSNRDTKDPLGYGRRRRSLSQNRQRTDFSQKLLVT
ncbi:uncharacterized protein WCC33_012298 [Rhinophrynus dorsalis]